MGAEISLKLNTKIIKEEEIKKRFLAGEVGAILDWEVKDKNGRVTTEGIKKSESFVRQFLELLLIQMYPISEAVPYNLRDTGNTVRTICESSYNFASNAAIGDITFGLVVGTGAVAPTINDYVLGTIILHDAAPPTAGRLQYGAVTFGAPASDVTTTQFTITRNFANASGGAITVNEIGCYVKGYDPTTTYYFMTLRDVIGGGILIPNGQTLTVNYRPLVVT
jgi:hypothetical protein